MNLIPKWFQNLIANKKGFLHSNPANESVLIPKDSFEYLLKKKSNLIGWVIIFVAPLPFFACFFHFLSKAQELTALDFEIERIHTKVTHLEQIQKRESALLAPLKNPDPQYLDKYVETLHFLLPEIKKLEALQLENFDDELLNKRLQFLKSNHNQLTLNEEQIRSNDLFKEIEATTQHTIEVNEEDLKRLLCLIEGSTIWPYGPKEGRPLLIIKDFTLSKKELFSKEKVFVISMQLIKRESL